MEGQLAEKRVRLELSPSARLWLAERGYDPTFGARPLSRLIQTEIKDILADEILFGRLRQGGDVKIMQHEDCFEEASHILRTENLCFLVTEAAPAKAPATTIEETVS
jgi:ATP-dependent Clp protease ATP-binding subunit ClpA